MFKIKHANFKKADTKWNLHLKVKTKTKSTRRKYKRKNCVTLGLAKILFLDEIV